MQALNQLQNAPILPKTVEESFLSALSYSFFHVSMHWFNKKFRIYCLNYKPAWNGGVKATIVAFWAIRGCQGLFLFLFFFALSLHIFSEKIREPKNQIGVALD